jgi:hypothetical protein
MSMLSAIRASAALVLLAGCGFSSAAAPGGDHERAPDGRVADYFSPPQEFPGPTWSRFGHPVSGFELNSVAGPRHCDWQQAVMMHVGWPLGTVAKDITQARQYIRDPRGVIDQKYRSGLRRPCPWMRSTAATETPDSNCGWQTPIRPAST